MIELKIQGKASPIPVELQQRPNGNWRASCQIEEVRMLRAPGHPAGSRLETKSGVGESAEDAVENLRAIIESHYKVPVSIVGTP